MNPSDLQHPQSLPVWFRVLLYLAVFLSPTAYVLLLLTMGGVPAQAEGFVVLLFHLIPVVALLASGAIIWRSKITLGWKISWLILTVLAMFFQCGVWFVIVLA
jgi:hypothetical protein